MRSCLLHCDDEICTQSHTKNKCVCDYLAAAAAAAAVGGGGAGVCA